MESKADGRVQIEDNAGHQVSPACLRFPHILRQILEHCSNSELLQLSLVNKQWNYEARSVIKERGTADAHLDPHQPCTDVGVFAAHLRQMNVVPYSGITIDFDRDYDDEADRDALGCEPYSSKRLNSAIAVILNRLPLKRLSVEFKKSWELYEYCAAFRLMKRILRDYCGILESLNVGMVFKFDEFIRCISPRSNFPRLKNLKVRCFSPYLEGGERMFIKALVSRAPNLQELHLDYPVHDHRDLLEGSSAVLVVDSEVDPFNNGTHDGPIGALRLRRMRLRFKDTSAEFSMDRLNRILPMMLQISRCTLHSLSLDAVFAPSLMRFGIRLENVTKLIMHLNGQLKLDAPEWVNANVSLFWRILKNFNFTNIFPKLNEVEISSSHSLRLSPREISQFVDQGDVIFQEPTPDRATNIKNLKCKLSPSDVTLLASMFPNIETLSIKNSDARTLPFGLVCQHWSHLKQLAIHAQWVRRENLDSLLCGLFPEEIAQLREKDEEYLKAVNLVPIKPSITCMKKLRTFTLFDTGSDFLDGEIDPTVICSEVTALIAFSRCPNLSVTLHINSKWENAWSHMKKYASIVIV